VALALGAIYSRYISIITIKSSGSALSRTPEPSALHLGTIVSTAIKPQAFLFFMVYVLKPTSNNTQL
jgi:hypothetical protein